MADHKERVKVTLEDWLQKRVTVFEAEVEHWVVDKGNGSKVVPFGRSHDEWNRFKSQMRNGDELWYYDSGGHSWACIRGRRGYAIVRDGRVIASYLTAIS